MPATPRGRPPLLRFAAAALPALALLGATVPGLAQRGRPITVKDATQEPGEPTPTTSGAPPAPAGSPTGLPVTPTPTATTLPFAVPLATGLTATDVTGLGRAVAMDAGLERADRNCVDRLIGEAVLQGCEGTRCAEAVVARKVLSLADLTPGTVLRQGQLRRALDRLMDKKLGFFRAVQVRCLPDLRGNAHITLQVTGNQFVREIDFRGNRALYSDELDDKLLLRPGDVLNPDDPDGLAALHRQREVIEAAYQRAGYAKVEVETRTEAIRADELRVVLRIHEGVRQRVDDYRVHSHALPPASQVEQSAGLVCPRIRDRDVLEASELQKADVFTERQANKARSRVRTFLRQLGYGNPRIDIDLDQADQTVAIDIRPGRCNLVRIFVREAAGSEAEAGYQLVDEKEAKELARSLPFGESGVFDFEEAELGRAELQAVFENRGYLFADVQLDFRPVPRLLGSQVEHAITYRVTTGYISQVRGIAFPSTGARHFDEGRLRAELSSKAYDFFDVGGYVQVDQLLADLDALRQFYQAQGFYQFRYPLGLPEDVTPTGSGRRRIELEDATVFEYRFAGKGFQIRKPHGENFVYIDVPIEEGRQARLRALQVEGARRVSERQVRKLLGLRADDVISYPLLDQALQKVTQHYRNAGFFRMELKALCATRGPDAAEGPCLPRTLLAREVDLRLVLTEGEQVDVGEVFVTGSFKTRDEVILRDMPKSGAPFSADALFEAQRRLRNLGIFSQVNFQYIGTEEKPPRKRIAVVVQVVELQSRFMEYAVGFQAVNRVGQGADVPSVVSGIEHLTAASDRLSSGFGQSVAITLPNLLGTLEAAYVDRNFLKRGKELRIPIKLGLTQPPGDARDWHDQAARGFDQFLHVLRVATIVPSYFDSRLLGSDFGLQVRLPYLKHDYAVGRLDTDKFGGIVELSRRFGRLSAATGVDVGMVRTKDPIVGCPQDDAGNRPESCELRFATIVKPSATWDDTDSPLNPTRGLFGSASLPYILFQGDQYLKYEVTGKGYVSVGPSLTLATMLRAGQGISFSEDPARPGEKKALPVEERFRLGGQHFVRGYLDDGLRQSCSDGSTRIVGTGEGQDSCAGTPLSAIANPRTVGDGAVVLNGSAELRFPLLRDTGVWGAAFWDFGGIADAWGDLGLGTLRHGVGLGVRFLVSGQIPFRVDWGFAVDQRCRDIPTDQPATACVEDDVGQLNISLLYSF